MKRLNIKILIAVAAMALIVGLATLKDTPDSIRNDWPQRPVTIIVPSGAGGGTDQTSRMLAKRLKESFGQPFNIVNQGQGSGVVGISSIKNAKPDGYTLGIIYNFAHYLPMGQGDFSVKDFTPIAQYNFDPAGFHVRGDSSWVTLPEALDAIKENPEKFAIACGGGCGGSWPIAVVTLFDKWGVDLNKVKMIPGRGAAAALQDLAAGGMDVVPSSIPEAAALISSGNIRGLAVFSEERLSSFPNIPTLKEASGISLSLGAWRGMVGPAGLPDEIISELENAMLEIVSSEDWRAEMTERSFGIKWRQGENFKAFMTQQQYEVRALLENFGF